MNISEVKKHKTKQNQHFNFHLLLHFVVHTTHTYDRYISIVIFIFINLSKWKDDEDDDEEMECDDETKETKKEERKKHPKWNNMNQWAAPYNILIFRYSFNPNAMLCRVQHSHSLLLYYYPSRLDSRFDSLTRFDVRGAVSCSRSFSVCDRRSCMYLTHFLNHHKLFLFSFEIFITLTALLPSPLPPPLLSLLTTLLARCCCDGRSHLHTHTHSRSRSFAVDW